MNACATRRTLLVDDHAAIRFNWTRVPSQKLNPDTLLMQPTEN